ncbi:hypothetical protein GGI12_003123 [Dipsacomyces acuminosporus]|nr:hypothetical protein GGI12_003123 [Dipsacomyces acuminosporus]
MLPNETTAVADAIRLAHERRLQVIWNPAPMSPDLAANYPVALVDVLVVNETELVGLAQQIDGIQLPKDKKKHEYTAVARQVMKRLGSRVIIVTLGRDGSIGLVHKFKSNMHSLPVAGSNAASERLKASVIADEDIAEIHVDCSPVGADQVRDTTAAGDTWIGYFTAELARMQGASPESIGSHAALTPAMVQRAMTFATYASGIAITRMGAVPSIPERKDVEAFFKSKAIP